MLKSKIKPVRREQEKVSAFSLSTLRSRATAEDGPLRRRRSSAALPTSAFTLVEILVVVVLMSFIVLALMAVFNTTQAAFRASLTQTDVLEGGRSVIGLLKSDFETMTPSSGPTNVVSGTLSGDNIFGPAPVNFCVVASQYQYQSGAAPLVQSLTAASSSAVQRTNVLENFFILTRQNTTWTGIGYFVDTTSTNYLNPLYRFSMSTNLQAGPMVLYTNFLSAIAAVPIPLNPPNLSHLVDGVLHLTVHPYDINGRWMTNFSTFYTVGVTGYTTTNRNIWFSLPSSPLGGEVSFYMFSNTLPASVELDLGLLEDRTIQRAESLLDVSPAWARSNYLSQQSGQVHLFRQRFPIRNVDPSAYQ
jgi:type II secretory pathway component PulJ